MSDDVKAEKAPKKKKGLIGKLTPVLVGLLIGAAGVGGGLYAMKPEAFASDHAAPKEDPNAPKKVPREGAGEGHYEASYFAISQPFTSNLKDSSQFVQLSISLGTFYDETFLEKLKSHEMALRSAALLVIADESYDAVSTIAGKQALATKLKAVLNKTLKERGEVAGIDTVYFTSFVVQ
jgi:flagellar protein FliL